MTKRTGMAMASKEFRSALSDDTGASAVEYGLLVFAIAAVVVAVVFALGGVLQHMFSDTCGSVASLAASSSC